MRKNAADRISETDSFWELDEMLPARRSSRRFSSDTEAEEISLCGTARGEISEPIPKRQIPDTNMEKLDHAKKALTEAERNLEKATASDKTTEALNAARKALSEVEHKLKTVSAAASHDKRTAYDEWLANRDTLSDGSENVGGVICEYVPERNPLIKRVTVKSWDAKYSFYGRFRADALKYARVNGVPCGRVSFFSYTPQYSQLSDDQLACYLYWRDRVNDGEFPDIDYAYILLYIYEIINLPDVIPARDGADRLCRIWNAYRDKHKNLDRILPSWLCDYCLIGQVDPPTSVPTTDSSQGVLFLREYYAGYSPDSPSPYASALFACASDYDYRKSRFITTENHELFDRHIKNAFVYAFGKAEREGKTVFAPIGERSTVKMNITRDAYSGAVCAYNVKRRIEIEYLSCARSPELRFAVTDTVKYAENNVRALLGIRSRYHTPNLAMPLRSAVDEYFAPLKREQKKKPEEPTPEYEKYYDAGETDFSLAAAKSIEESSWATTGLLVSDTDEDSFSESQLNEMHLNTEPDTTANTIESGGSVGAYCAPASAQTADCGYIKEALSCVLSGNSDGFREIAKARGLLPDTLCEEINETLFDEFGDTVVFADGGRYLPIPEYTEDITEWMKR